MPFDPEAKSQRIFMLRRAFTRDMQNPRDKGRVLEVGLCYDVDTEQVKDLIHGNKCRSASEADEKSAKDTAARNKRLESLRAQIAEEKGESVNPDEEERLQAELATLKAAKKK